MFLPGAYTVKTAATVACFLQTMIGTVPPSALQAAPVTYDVRSEQRKTITAAISSGSASRPSGRPAPTDLGEHLIARALLLVGKAALAFHPHPGWGATRHPQGDDIEERATCFSRG
jgi:hypothetical protein